MFLKYIFTITSVFFLLTLSAQESVKAKVNRKIDITYVVKKIAVVNSTYADFSPSLNNDVLIFASDRHFDAINIGENRWNKKKFVNLFSTKITIPAQDSVIFSKPEMMLEQFKAINHIGPVFFSPDGKEAFLSMDEKEYGHVNKPQLYILKNENGKWNEKVMLPFVKEEYIYSHPALSDDGQTLYFVSDMPGGQGGKDIFYSKRNGDTWSEPVALGVEVNTAKDEMFPYFRNNVLYFATNGRASIGGLDLYKSEFTSSGKIKEAVTLGPTINSTADDFSFMLDKEMKSGFFSSNREGGKGEDDIYYFKVIETVAMISQDIEGKFAYKTLSGGSPDGMEVMLYDDNGQFIGKAVTDKDGYFRFENLPLDKNFTINTSENGNSLTLTILDAEGEPAAFLLSDKNGAFIYKRLSMDYTGTLALMEVDDTQMGRVNGQFVYEKLGLGDASGLNVYLVDDKGNIIYKSKTDANGNFEFKSLPLGSNYIIKTDANNNDMVMYIFNKNNEVTAQMRMNENGEFTYRKLNPDYASISLMETQDTEMLAAKSNNIEGNFVFKNLKGTPADMEFEILNDNNEIIYKGKTDAKGGFFVTGLPISGSYLFKISETDPNFKKDMELNILSRTNVKIATLVKDENGIFVYKQLNIGNTNVELMENADVSLQLKNYTVYFDYDSYALSDESKKVLDDVVSKMKSDKLLKLVINAHTDSRNEVSFNDALSQRRMKAVKNYISQKGIPASRMNGNSYGETQLVNKCTDGVECTEAEHAANRRAEIQFLKN